MKRIVLAVVLTPHLAAAQVPNLERHLLVTALDGVYRYMEFVYLENGAQIDRDECVWVGGDLRRDLWGEEICVDEALEGEALVR